MKKKLMLLLALLFSSGCSSNIKSEWECPKLNSPYGCVGLSEIDKFAIRKLEDKEITSKEHGPKIWTSPSAKPSESQTTVFDEVAHD